MSTHKFVPNTSLFPMRFNTPEEEYMRGEFIKVASGIVEHQETFNQDDSTLLAGIELELPLVNSDMSLASQQVRDGIIAKVPNTSVELAAHQIELTPESPADLKSDLLSLEKAMEEVVTKVKETAKVTDTRWIRLGSYPLCRISDVDYTKGKPKYIKYERSPRWHMDNQRPDAEKYILTREGPLDVSSGYIVGLMSAVQVTIDALSMEDAIDKLNRSFMISPLAVALASNSSYLAHLDTGYTDVRFITWEISHDTRTEEEVKSGFPTRVGLPARYFVDINDYFNQVLSYPFVMNDTISLEHAFEVGNGIFWRDVRIKFFRDKNKLGIEFRPVAIQPSLHEDVSIMLFYIGRLLWSQKNKEALLDMSLVRENKLNAMSVGMKSLLYTTASGGSVIRVPASCILPDEIYKARKGLELLGSDSWKLDHYLDTMMVRLKLGSPAEQFNKAIERKKSMNEREMHCNLVSTIDELGLLER